MSRPIRIPKKEDGTIDWRRVYDHPLDLWEKTNEEAEAELTRRVLRGMSHAPEEDQDEPARPLLECTLENGFRHFAGANGAKQMQMMFDDIKYRHHSEGFDDEEFEYEND